MRKKANDATTYVAKLAPSEEKRKWNADMVDAYFDVEQAYRDRNGSEATVAYNKINELIKKGYNFK